MRRRVLSAAIALVLFGLVLATASAAIAAAPPSAPVTVKSYTFESSADTPTAMYPYAPSSPTAWWGISTNATKVRTGLKSLWCGASAGPLVANYPANTAGDADFVGIPDTSKFYQSDLSWWYKYPDLDTLPFTERWFNAPKDPSVDSPDRTLMPSIDSTSVWSQVVHTRTGYRTTLDNTMSPAPGALQYRFSDANGGLLGIAIDDVAVTGYRFAAVRNLAAVRNGAGTQITVTWDKPGASVAASNTPTSENPSYRVWRHDVGPNTWSEVTSDTARVLDPTRQFVDSPVLKGHTYEYVVTAYGTGSESAYWGYNATSSPVAALTQVTTITATFAGSQVSTVAASGAQLKVSGTLSDVDGLPLTGMASATFVQTSADGSSWATASPSIPVIEASAGSYSATVTIAPNDHYFRFAFVGSGVYVASVSSPSISVSVLPSYAIVPSAGVNGTISPSTVQTVLAGADSTTFTISPNTGFHVENVLVDGSSIGAPTAYKFTSVSASHTISATFSINTYTIAPTASANGTISPSTIQTVNHGADSTTFTVTPSTGYHIASLLVDGSSVGVPAAYKFTSVTASHTIAASFAINAYQLHYGSTSNGTISGSASQTVDYGSSGSTVTATPGIGYHFTGWSDGVLTASRREANVTTDTSLTASFAINTYQLHYGASANGSVSGTASQTVAYGSSGATVTATPDDGYRFVSWSDGILTAARRETNVTADASVTANFVNDSTYVLQYTAGDGGSVEGSASQMVAHGANGTTVTAKPSDHHYFVKWSDGLTAAARQETNVIADVSVTASFAPETHPIVPNAGANGTIEPSTTQMVDYGSDSPTFTIIPDSGYRVRDVLVDGSSKGALPAYKFTNVIASGTITVTFEPDGPGKPISRLSGPSRYATAVNIGLDAYPRWAGVRDLVLASGDNNHQPDALTGAGLAGAYNCPLLLTPTNYVDADLKAAISAMPKGVRVHIVGGTPAVSAKVAGQIKAISKVASVDRISGTDRYATAAAVAVKMKSLLGKHFPTIALLTNGSNPTLLLDPLIASTASAYRHFPVLLLQPNQAPSVTRTTLANLKLSTRYVVGSRAAVPDAVLASLSIPQGNRIGGSDVLGDAVAFADRAKALGWLTNSYIGFAASVPDAATGGGYMGKKGGSLLLVLPTSVPTVTSDWLTANRGTVLGGYVFGGPPAVSDAVVSTLHSLIQ